jgi:WD40 repeat protein
VDTLRALERAIRTNIHFIARHPQALFQCIWNICWWHGSPEALFHYEQDLSKGRHIIQKSPADKSVQLSALLEEWLRNKEAECPDFVWLRSRRPPEIEIDSAQAGVIRGHEAPVNCLALTRDGSYLASGSDDCTVRVWDTQSSAQCLCLHGHTKNISAVSFSPLGDRIVSGGGAFECSIRVWDIKMGIQVWSSPVFPCPTRHQKRVTDVGFSDDGQIIVSSSMDKTLRIWNAETGEQKFCLSGHKGPVKKVAFIPGREQVISTGIGSWNFDDASIHLWDAQTGAHFGCLLKDVGIAHIKDLKVSQDGTWFAVAGGGLGFSGIRIFDVDTGEMLMQLREDHLINSISASTDGSKLVCGSNSDGSISIWNIGSRTKLESFRSPERQIHGRDDNDELFVVAFLPDGLSIYSAAGLTIRRWQVGAEQRRSTLVNHSEKIRDITFSHDTSKISTAAYDDVVNIWNCQTGARELCIKTNNKYFWPANSLFSPDDQCIFLSGHSRIRVWEVRTGKELESFKGRVGEGGPGNRIALSSDGRLLCSWSSVGRRINIWDVKKRRLLCQLNCREEGVHTEENVAFSRDSALIAYGSDCEVLPSGLFGPFDIDRHRIRVIDLINSLEALQLRGHRNTITSLCFSPDARFLVSGSLDATARLWNLNEGIEQFCFSGHKRLSIAWPILRMERQ